MTNTDLNHLDLNLLDWPTSDLEAWKRTPLRGLDFSRYHPYPAGESYSEDIASGGAHALTGTAPDRASSESASSESASSESAASEDAAWAGEIVFNAGRLVSARLTAASQKLGLRLDVLGLQAGRPGRHGTVDTPGPVEELLKKVEDRVEDRVQAWSLSEMTHGLALTIPEKVSIELPFLIEFREAGKETHAASQLVVLLGAGAKAAVVTRYSAENDKDILVNAGIYLSAEENSSLSFTLSEDTHPKTRFFGTLRAFIAKNAEILFTETHIGKGLMKTQGSFDLEGPGSSVRLHGAYLVEEGGHAETGAVQRHASSQASSTALYKGVVHPKGRSVFQGLIVVEEGATKTDAYLSNKNLLLGAEARADSIPRLIIKNDDVRCTHGSTTGKIDEGELFYLRARGLSLEEAKRLIVSGFFENALASVPEAERSRLRKRIDLSLEKS